MSTDQVAVALMLKICTYNVYGADCGNGLAQRVGIYFAYEHWHLESFVMHVSLNFTDIKTLFVLAAMFFQGGRQKKQI